MSDNETPENEANDLDFGSRITTKVLAAASDILEARENLMEDASSFPDKSRIVDDGASGLARRVNNLGERANRINIAGDTIRETIEDISSLPNKFQAAARAELTPAAELMADILYTSKIDELSAAEALTAIASWEEKSPEIEAQLRVAYADGDVTPAESLTIFANRGHGMELDGDISLEARQHAMQVMQASGLEDLDGYLVDGLSRLFESKLREGSQAEAAPENTLESVAEPAREFDAEALINKLGIEDDGAIESGVSYLVNSDFSAREVEHVMNNLIEMAESLSMAERAAINMARSPEFLFDDVHRALRNAGIENPDPRLIESTASIIHQGIDPDKLQELSNAIVSEIEAQQSVEHSTPAVENTAPVKP